MEKCLLDVVGFWDTLLLCTRVDHANKPNTFDHFGISSPKVWKQSSCCPKLDMHQCDFKVFTYDFSIWQVWGILLLMNVHNPTTKCQFGLKDPRHIIIVEICECWISSVWPKNIYIYWEEIVTWRIHIGQDHDQLNVETTLTILFALLDTSCKLPV